MFTGIIQELGKVKTVERRGLAASLKVTAPRISPSLSEGESVAVNGACLTVVLVRGNTFTADLSPETMEVTNLGQLQSASPVNLERPVSLSDLLGGHLVTGHVDGVGRIVAKERQADNIVFKVEVPGSVARYLLPKGSIAVEGISLTVINPADSVFTVTIIPHTLRNTNLGGKEVGASVNLEADLIGKYVEKFVAGEGQKQDSLLGLLEQKGFR